MLGAAVSGPVNLGNPDELDMLELAAVVLELTGANAPIVHVAPAADDPERRKPDIALLRRTLRSFEATVDLRTGLERTASWTRQMLSR